MAEQSIRLNGWRGNVLSGVILAAITAGASGLFTARSLATDFERMQADYRETRAKVDRLWEEGIRQESTREEIQKARERQDAMARKLDLLLLRQGIDPERTVEDR